MILLVVKSLKNPRSAVCKTAIMTSTDIFSAYNDNLIDSLDPLVSFAFWQNSYHFMQVHSYSLFSLNVIKCDGCSLHSFFSSLHKTKDLYVKQLKEL